MTTSKLNSAKQPEKNILQWQIWDVEWPHEDGTSKRRPALVVSTSAHNASSDEIWVVKISSKFRDVPHRLTICTTDPAFKTTGLKKDSHFYLKKVKLLNRSRFYEQRKPGQLTGITVLMTAIALKKAVPQSLP